MPDLLPFENRSADHLRLVLEAGHIGIWELDLQSGEAVRNRTHDEIFGYPELLPKWTYDQFLQHVMEIDRERVDELQKATIAEKREWSFECQIRTASGQIRWIRAAGRPLLNPAGDVEKLIGHVVDITESKQSEARLRLITEELNHRVRNMLAIIRSMVKISARRAQDIPAFAEALEGRVGALARTHHLLAGETAGAMKPSTILREELSVFDDVGERIGLIVLDETGLSASAAQGLALVFHELLTNALKYGALSADEGRIEIRVDRDAETLNILWKEHGGPPVDPDTSDGFGSMLIAEALAAEGTTTQRFLPEGLECHITLDIA